jgi:hypothetical protein
LLVGFEVTDSYGDTRLQYLHGVWKFKPIVFSEDDFCISFLVTYAQREADEIVLVSRGLLAGVHLCWMTEPSVACGLIEE